MLDPPQKEMRDVHYNESLIEYKQDSKYVLTAAYWEVILLLMRYCDSRLIDAKIRTE